MNNHSPKYLSLYLLIISLFLSSCTHRERERVVEMVTPPFEPSNYGGITALPIDIKRIGIMPAYFGPTHPRLLEDLNDIIRQEISKRNVAEIIPISELFLVHKFNKTAIDSTTTFPHDFFTSISKEYAPDALLFVDITRYSPYKPMAIGIRCKLITSSEGKILWSFDMIFDSGDPLVAAAAKSFERRYSKISYPLSVSTSILQSPNRFTKFVTHAVFSTFPERDTRMLTPKAEDAHI